MATRKQTGKQSAASAKRAESLAQRQVYAIILFALGVLIGALSLIDGDSFWLTLHQTLFGLFGFSAFLIGPLLIYIAIMASLDQPTGSIKGKLIQISILVTLVSSAVQVFSYGPLQETGLWSCITELFGAGVQLNGGGLISAVAGLPLMAICGRTGAKVLLVLLIFVLVMILTGVTLIGFFRGAAKPVQRIGQTYARKVQERAERPAVPTPAAEIAAAPSKRFNVDVPLAQAQQPRQAAKSEKAARTETPPVFMPLPTVLDPLDRAFEESIPRGSFVKRSLETPLDAARDALFSAAHPAGHFDFDIPLADDMPSGSNMSPNAFGATGAIPGVDNVLRFRTTPADAPSRPQSTDAVIDEILRSARAQDPSIDPLDEKLDEGLNEALREAASVEPFAPPAFADGAQFDPIDLNAAYDTVIVPPPFDESELLPLEQMPAFFAPVTADELPPLPTAEIPATPRMMATTAPVTPVAPPKAPTEPLVYEFPPVSLLSDPPRRVGEESMEELKANAQRLVDTLKSFGVQTRIIDIARGPAVTRYELQPSAGVKISKITSLADDIALNLAAAGVRIEAPIPNKPAVGIEVPNRNISTVCIREIIDSPEFMDAKSPLSAAMGKDITGRVTVADIAKMPHMLIAGATGSGKSVCINSIIISLLYKSAPDKVKFLMIDPKVVELGIYNGIPHLLVPVVTEPKKAAGALAWAVGEMLKRYKLFADNQARDISGFNRMCETNPDLSPLPQIVIIIDELADLMMAAPNEVEDYICRLAQMARAAGMHLVIATQRPSVDVITGIIKANIPSRIAFAVSSSIDSRTILDSGGAEKLLGRGDMLFYPVGSPKPVRVQGCFVSDQEVEKVVAFIKRNGTSEEYDAHVMEEIERQAIVEKKKKGSDSADDDGGFDGEDDMLPAAIECVVEMGMASTSMLQRKLKLGYARAARIVDQMEEKGIVGPFEGSKPRQVLLTRDQFYEMKMNGSK